MGSAFPIEALTGSTGVRLAFQSGIDDRDLGLGGATQTQAKFCTKTG
ncbi:hypothetical protein GFS31_05130 [Leptolyngbya sp. BL0902]|nr:hypothetical protein GFS31_05130 [Leptolyngbya sp. BL0902]